MAAQDSMLAGRRLLVVDDEEFGRFFVVRMLREMGCEDILQAGDGVEALKQLEPSGNTLSCVILDFNMPNANGLQVLKAIRTDRAGVPRGTNVLMLTGNSDFGLVGAAMSLDVDAFLIKPVSKAVLTERLERMFQESREIKPAAAYQAVDIEVINKRLLSRKPVTTSSAKSGTLMPGVNGKKPGTAAQTTAGTVRVNLDNVAAGAILAENIRGQAGELLLGAATVLSPRLLLRLKELQPVLKLEYLSIYAKEGAKQG